MSKLVLDSYAWIEYLDGTPLGHKVAKSMVENEVFTCGLTIAEVVSKVSRKKMDVNLAYDIVTNNSTVINPDEELSKEAGLLHCEMRKTVKDFGLADAYIRATARRLGIKVLTGDSHFESVKDAIMLK